MFFGPLVDAAVPSLAAFKNKANAIRIEIDQSFDSFMEDQRMR